MGHAAYALLLDAIHSGNDDDVLPRTTRDSLASRVASNGVTRDVLQSDVASDAERVLIEQLRAGEAQALETLMQRYFDRLARLAWHLLRSRDAAEDVAQEIFVRIWSRRETLDPTRPIGPFLLAAARHRALNDLKYEHVRRRHRETVVMADEFVMTAVDPDDTEAVDRLLHVLPERQQTAIRLRFVEQMPIPDIAQVLGIAPNAAHQLIFRALTTLRRALGAKT